MGAVSSGAAVAFLDCFDSFGLDFDLVAGLANCSKLLG